MLFHTRLQHIDAILDMLRRRQRQYAEYRQDICVMDSRWVQNVYGRYTKQEENKKIAAEQGTEVELVEWDRRVVFDPMTGCRDSQVIPWTRAREILYVVNFKDMHWFTFRFDLQDWTITVLDCQKDIVKMQHNSVDFNTMMEVSK